MDLGFIQLLDFWLRSRFTVLRLQCRLPIWVPCKHNAVVSAPCLLLIIDKCLFHLGLPVSFLNGIVSLSSSYVRLRTVIKSCTNVITYFHFNVKTLAASLLDVIQSYIFSIVLPHFTQLWRGMMQLSTFHIAVLKSEASRDFSNGNDPTTWSII